MEETKIAISEGVSSISTTNSHNYFRNCGYIYNPITLMLHMYKLYKAAESSNKYLPPFTKRHVFNNSLLRHLPVGLCKEA